LRPPRESSALLRLGAPLRAAKSSRLWTELLRAVGAAPPRIAAAVVEAMPPGATLRPVEARGAALIARVRAASSATEGARRTTPVAALTSVPIGPPGAWRQGERCLPMRTSNCPR
jgi:hypothetical protein